MQIYLFLPGGAAVPPRIGEPVRAEKMSAGVNGRGAPAIAYRALRGCGGAGRSSVVGDDSVPVLVVVDPRRVPRLNLEGAVGISVNRNSVIAGVQRDRQPASFVKIFPVFVDFVSEFRVDRDGLDIHVFFDIQYDFSCGRGVVVAGGKTGEQRQAEKEFRERFHRIRGLKPENYGLIVSHLSIDATVGIIDGGRVAGPNLERTAIEAIHQLHLVVPRVERDRQPWIVLIEIFGIRVDQAASFGIDV